MLDLLFGVRCVCCGRGHRGLCDECERMLEEPPERPAPDGLDALVALCAYGGVGSELVLALKRGNRRGAVPLLGGALADGLTATPTGHGGSITVTWAPTTAPRRRRRGFDQAELLARATARSGGWPARNLLRRTSEAQMGRGGESRRCGVAFDPRGSSPETVAVVDDVATSGATMSAAAAALRRAGARTVVGLVVATA